MGVPRFSAQLNGALARAEAYGLNSAKLREDSFVWSSEIR